MSRVLIGVVFLAAGLAIGFWLALGPGTPVGVVQSWDHVKTEAQQLWSDVD